MIVRPPGGFEVILADPAWKYSDKRLGRGGAEAHYETLTPQQIRDMGPGIQMMAADDCVLFLWATGPMLANGVANSVVSAWGFEGKTMAFTWIKITKNGRDLAWGTGGWTRSNPEFCLLGVRGKPKRVSASVHSVIRAPRGEHSAKPPETRDRIVELMGDVPRIELFARERVEGWHAHGDQLPALPGKG